MTVVNTNSLKIYMYVYIHIYIYIYIYIYILESSGRAPSGLDSFQDSIVFYTSVWAQEANPTFKNDLEPCGVIFLKYGPVAGHGDPIQVQTSRNEN